MSDFITVEVLGKSFQIKCTESEVFPLQKASNYLDEQMQHFRDQGVKEFDKIAVIAALNIAHLWLNHEQQKENDMQAVNQRLIDLRSKIEQALIKTE